MAPASPGAPRSPVFPRSPFKVGERCNVIFVISSIIEFM